MVRPYMDVDEIAINGRTNLILMDNNILAAGEYGMEQLQKIAERGYRVDFNQAMDARLVTDEVAEILARIKWAEHIRFGCDTKKQIDDCESAISLIDKHGYKGRYFLYTMIGGHSELKDDYERVMHWWKRNNELSGGRYIRAFAQPYIDFSTKHQIIPQWQKDMAAWCNKPWVFNSTSFDDFQPRKGFYCREYLT